MTAPEPLTDSYASPPATSRIQALDVIRGVAILGTFGTSVWFITAPGGAASWSIGAVDDAGVVETILRAIPNGKFLALLTLLFGIGLELQYRSAVRRGLHWPGRYLRRAAVLGVEGLLHYLLVFEYDVLMGYSIASIAVAFLIGRSDRAHRLWMTGTGFGLAVVVSLSTVALLVLPPLPAIPVGSTASLPDQILTRIVDFPLYRIEILLIVPQAVVLFLLAARLHRAGVFGSGEAPRRLRARLMGWGLGVGVPLNAATAWAGSDWFLVERYVAAPLIAVGGLALITHVVLHLRRPGVVSRRVAEVGRTALTCYVMQNVLACALAYDWGLGLNSRLGGLGSGWPMLLWAFVAAANVLFARAWLRHHDRDPLAQLAHRLS